ncbi:GMC family oxidoreductase [Rouxiella badensis]|jgi:choline dehydrogenase-like flavoprotein|uniref:Choline dehydrogenase n=2 Tax=Rouxiella badensis TaxID=1646377 RepID=A0A1X0WA06_9GAMM|nr:GMC family oxidoreductase [Rouxiella badensis]MCC3702835.1 GMC family oxidoreductase [Rouxiella badensis]ORJ23571.1 choline dehydrogenase [Rouxiella badensis]
MSNELSADVVVIGAGICGGFVAQELAQAGLSVLVLEAGPRWERAQVVENWRNMPPVNKSESDYATPYPASPWAVHPQLHPYNEYPQVDGPDASAYRQGVVRGVGGTTWHWAASTWRFLPHDLQLYSTYGVGRDWAVTYDELEDYYYRAEVAMGVNGPNDTTLKYVAPRKQPFPMEPMPYGPADRRFTEVVAKAGYENTPVPQARNSRPYNGRPQCCGNNNCMPICPIGAMFNGIHAIVKAEEYGAKIISNAVVYSMETNTSNEIVAVNFYDPDKKSTRVTGKTFVLAGNGIESPKLLLLAANDRNPNGIANSSGHVGRNMMDHPGILMSFQAAEPIWTGGGSVQMSSITNFRDGDFRRDRSAIQIGMNNTSQNHKAGVKALQMGLVGKKLDEEIRRRAACGMDIYVNHDILANPDNRLRLSTTKKDGLGIPYPHITYDVGDYVRRAEPSSRQHLQQIAELFGATEIESTPYFNPNNHIMGGTIMGHDPKDSVVDGWMRTHDHRNLFIASGGAMASAGTVNSTLSMVALSLRAVDAIKKDMLHA